MLNKASLIRISFAMAVISLYTYVFGVMDIVGDNQQTSLELEAENDFSDAPTEPEYDEATALDITNRRVPVLSDFDAPVVPNMFFDPSDNEETDLFTEPTPTPAPDEEIDTIPNPPSTMPPSASPTPATSGSSGNSGSSTPADTFRIRSTSGASHEGDAFDIATRVVQAEIGSSFHREAIKAQAVAVYTYIKRQNNAGKTPTLPIASTASERVRSATEEVWGKAIYHNNELIQAVFSASSAGWSSSARNVWGEDLVYVRSQQTEFDQLHDPNWGRTVTFTANEIKENVEKKTGIKLSGNPANWLKINTHVDTVYVGEMSIGGKTSYRRDGKDVKITGRNFREHIMEFGLRSASFTISYSASRERFTFTTNGYGHGAGMSQNGANILATHQGKTYEDILKFYYTGVEIR